MKKHREHREPRVVEWVGWMPTAGFSNRGWFARNIYRVGGSGDIRVRFRIEEIIPKRKRRK